MGLKYFFFVLFFCFGKGGGEGKGGGSGFGFWERLITWGGGVSFFFD